MRVEIDLSELEVSLLRRIASAIDLTDEVGSLLTEQSSVEELVSALSPAQVKMLAELFDAGAISPATKQSRKDMGLSTPRYNIQKALVDLGLIDNEPRRAGLCLTEKALAVLKFL